MAKKKKSTSIRTQEEVLNKLGIKNIKELKEDKGAQERFVKMSYRVSPEIIKKVIDIVPSLIEVYSEVIQKSSDIALSLEETIRFRWQAFVDIANTGLLTGDQIIEAMRILAEIEDKERKRIWKTLMKIIYVTGGIIATILAIIGGVVALLAITKNDDQTS